ncbi:FtsX-like permease family protein [Cellulomonas septica]|uniref:ABC transporter permease n=1 Tax=Cellulomonas septica TaxID=285080 RepID=A0ABX1JZH0_9CELL|nr:FtsX-like permease family protein [Cellulomonas septica]NKY38690.1 ABC transporter permease [Cellulomonas septica]
MTSLRSLLGESGRVAFANRASSLVVVAVTAATCLLALATAGRSAATESAVVASIDRAGSRLIVVTSASPEDRPPPDVVRRATALADVDWALAVGPAIDVRNAAVSAAAAVPARAMYGDPPPDLRLLAGRWPAKDEVIVSSAVAPQLGLTAAAGSLVATDGKGSWDVVGTFEAEGALTDLDRVVLLGPDRDQSVGVLYAVASTPQSVAPVSRLLRQMADVRDPTTLSVTTSDELVELSAVVTGQLGVVARQQASGAMAAGLIFTAVTLYASIGARRRDFGRRRALGASRSALVLLVIGQAMWPALVGVALGTAAGLAAVARITGGQPPVPFTAAVSVLAVISAVVASVPAALAAAMRDPVQILRVP